MLTWPEGNGWLTRQLAAPLAGRLHTGRSVWRVREARHAVEIDAWDEAGRRSERWTAQHVVLAMPLFIAARLLESPPDALQRAAAHGRQAPWLVANLHLDAALRDRPGAAPAWDNVNYDPAGSASLGYVDAMHQSLRPYAGPTVLTAYWALGDDAAVQRRRLLDTPWSAWAQAVLQDLARLHPDLPGKLRQVDLMRYGHAMAMPLPGRRSDAALQALAMLPGRIAHAHSDLSAYSVFEEAYGQGLRAARQVLRVRGASA